MGQPRKYYLAGPMTGLPYANIPTFDAAAADLRSRGYDITSPAELDDAQVRKESVEDSTGLKHSGSWGEFLARDVKLISDELNAVVVLPGWGNSRGANLEVYVAITCGYPLYRYAPDTVEGMTPMSYYQAFKEILRRLQVAEL